MYGDKDKCSYFIPHLVLNLNIVSLIPPAKAQSLKNSSTYTPLSPTTWENTLKNKPHLVKCENQTTFGQIGPYHNRAINFSPF